MESPLRLEILAQPDVTTCGPTCLHAIYRYHGDEIPLGQVIAESSSLDDGGTLAVFLGCHALKRGYRATIYTYNLHMFDPTWFWPETADLEAKLLAQQASKAEDSKLQVATRGYLEYLQLGGRIRFEDLTTALLRRYLERGIPILTGLSSTYLYHSAREHGYTCRDDDVRGYPAGHFVVVYGYEPVREQVLVADPHQGNPVGDRHYEVGISRLIGSILLGIVTHDANFIILEKNRTP